MALMAHGGPRGQLLGADEQEVQPEALVQELCCCPTLRSCPKIILVQACRGGEWHSAFCWSPPALVSCQLCCWEILTTCPCPMNKALNPPE